MVRTDREGSLLNGLSRRGWTAGEVCSNRKPALFWLSVAGIGLVLLVSTSCQSLMPSPFWPSPTPAERSKATPQSDIAPPKHRPEWVIDPLAAEKALAGPLQVRSSSPVEHGQTRTSRLLVYSALSDVSFGVKWKAAKPSLDGINNSPRREIAAYQIQRLVLEPEDYVVPTTSLLCLPPDAIPGGGQVSENGAGVDCLVGTVSLWLEGLRYPRKKIDWQRFSADPAYAHHAANLNVVGILMDHSDTHTRNLLVSQDPANRRIYSIDNGISFNTWFRSPFSRDWNRVRVPALRADTIKRLRTLRRADLDYLETLAELRRNASGLYAPVRPGAILSGRARRGVRVDDGVIQMGLTTSEVDAVWRRIQRILALVNAGRVSLF